MVVHRTPFSKPDKVVAWILAFVWVVGGGVAGALSVVNSHWRLGLASVGAVALGILYAVATRRGRPRGKRLAEYLQENLPLYT